MSLNCMMLPPFRFPGNFASILLGVGLTVIQSAAISAPNPVEVNAIAKSITVLIDGQNPGSGVLIYRDDQTYTVLTALHVVESADEYDIVTPDNKRYRLNYNTVRAVPSLDLAILQFRSTEKYEVARLGDSNSAVEGTTIYIAGFPIVAGQRPVYTFTQGRITGNVSNRPLPEGYALIYDNSTVRGMSGGPILNDEGRLVGIHGGFEGVSEKGITVKAFSLGIPINRFLGKSVQPSTPVAVPTVDDYIRQAREKVASQDFKAALEAYNRALSLSPNYAEAYQSRGMLKQVMADHKGAISDFDQVLRLDPQKASAYVLRALSRSALGEQAQALEDVDRALQLEQNNAEYYIARGKIRGAQGERQGAIADFDQAILLQPDSSLAYFLRGNTRWQLQDAKGAITDYDQALRFNPNDTLAYFARGNAYLQSGNSAAALNDFDQMVRLEPEDGLGYFARGQAQRLQNPQAAISDFRQAAQFAQARGNAELAEAAQKALQSLQP